jgi:O-antigen/teichoic acid export membrane protein
MISTKKEESSNGTVTGNIIFGISATWIRMVTAIVVNFIQLPLLYHYLHRELIGIYLIFSSLGTFLLLWDMGLGITFARSMSYFRGSGFSKVQMPEDNASNASPEAMIKTVTVAYCLLALALYLLALLTGRIYFCSLKLSIVSFSAVWVSWCLYALGCALNLGAATPLQCLNGLGDVGIEQIIQALANLISLIAVSVGLAVGGELITLGAIFLMRGAVVWIAAWIILRQRHGELFIQKGHFSFACLKLIRGDSARMFITRVGAFLIMQIPGLVIAQRLSPSRVSDFMAMWMIVQLGMAGSLAIGQSMIPHLAAAYLASDMSRIKRFYFCGVRTSLAMIGLWSIGYYVWAREGFALWLGQGHFLGFLILIPMLITCVLEVHHAISANVVWASGRWPFAPWAIASGLLNLTLGVWWVSVVGEMGMALATCIAQLLTNNWLIVLYALRLLKIPVQTYIRETILPVAGVLAGAAAIAVTAKSGFASLGNLPGSIRGVPMSVVVSFMGGISVTILASFYLSWKLLIDYQTRNVIRTQISLFFHRVF